MKNFFKKQSDLTNLLSPIKIGSVTLKNHMFKPAAGTKLLKDNDGYVTEKGKCLYEAWAKGGAGCSVIESPAIGDALSIDIPNKYLINDDKFIPGLTELVDVIHKHDSVALLQLYHAGQWHLGMMSKLTPVSSSAHPAISELAVRRQGLLVALARLLVLGQHFMDAA